MDTSKFPLSEFGKMFENVYEPAEDTWILIDALEDDLEHLKENSSIFVECGSGSGAVSVSLSKSIGKSDRIFFTTDINPNACQCTLKCAEHNIGRSHNIMVVNTKFLDSLTDKLNDQVDTIIFNPPYVPTEGKELPPGTHIEASWAGGERGREVIEMFLINYLPKVLKKPTGRAYIVAIKQNNINEMLDLLLEYHIMGRVVKSRKAGTELLYVIRYEYSSNLI